MKTTKKQRRVVSDARLYYLRYMAATSGPLLTRKQLVEMNIGVAERAIDLGYVHVDAAGRPLRTAREVAVAAFESDVSVVCYH